MKILTPKGFLNIGLKKSGVAVEVGFGNGAFMRYLYNKKQNFNIIGVDIANISFNKAKSRLKDTDCVLVKSDATFFFKYLVDFYIDELYILFPDPWPKNKKRRLIKDEFVRLLRVRLKPGGYVYVATDDIDYMNEIIVVFKDHGFLVHEWLLESDTKYSVKWKKMGKDIFCCRFENLNHIPEPFWNSKVLKKVNIVLEKPKPNCETVMQDGAIVKIKRVYKSLDSVLYEILYAESGFTMNYFFIEKDGFLTGLNTWGEVFPLKFVNLLGEIFNFKEEVKACQSQKESE